MVDKVSVQKRRAIMRKVRSKDTKPEMIVRRMVHGMGYRYRLHRKDLPGKPDLVFGPRRAAIFVHGCFWHQHDCRRDSVPSSNSKYWAPKLARNVERDKQAQAALEAAGWRVMVVWECELKGEDAVGVRIQAFLEKPPQSG